jgi:hypothetical protein
VLFLQFFSLLYFYYWMPLLSLCGGLFPTWYGAYVQGRHCLTSFYSDITKKCILPVPCLVWSRKIKLLTPQPELFWYCYPLIK